MSLEMEKKLLIKCRGKDLLNTDCLTNLCLCLLFHLFTSWEKQIKEVLGLWLSCVFLYEKLIAL